MLKKKKKTPIVYTSEERVVQHSRLQKCWHRVMDDTSMPRCHTEVPANRQVTEPTSSKHEI